MAIFTSDSSSISVLVVTSSFIATSSIQFVTNSLRLDYGLGQGGSMSFASFYSTYPSGSHAEGSGSLALSYWSHVEGEKNTNSFNATQIAVHIEGFNNTLAPKYGHIEGANNTGYSSIYSSHIEGMNNLNNNPYSHIEGYLNTSSYNSANQYNHIEGVNNKTSGNQGSYQHIEGFNNIITQSSYIHVEGLNNLFTKIGNTNIHIEGSGSYSSIVGTANGYGNSHIEGANHMLPPYAISYNHIEGFNNIFFSSSWTNTGNQIGPEGSHILGANNTGSGEDGSFIFGYNNKIIPITYIKNAGPPVTQSLARVYASGLGLQVYNTASNYIQLFGHYNVTLLTGSAWEGYGHIVVGGGTSDANKANILEILIPFGASTSIPATNCHIVLPGIQSYAGNSQAIAAGVPIGGLYRGKNGTDINTIFIVTGSM